MTVTKKQRNSSRKNNTSRNRRYVKMNRYDRGMILKAAAAAAALKKGDNAGRIVIQAAKDFFKKMTARKAKKAHRSVGRGA
jgi:hypothetical protein